MVPNSKVEFVSLVVVVVYVISCLLHINTVEMATEVTLTKSTSRASNSTMAAALVPNNCRRQESIFFLKTSKTGSTTVANILYRFGFKYGKTFLFGEQANGAIFFENGFLPFNEEKTCYLGKTIPNRPQFDISAIHLRYNKTAINKLMRPDVKKISILRSPTANFISSWRYYSHLNDAVRKKLDVYSEGKPNFIAEIKEFLESPWDYLRDVSYDNSAYFFLVNPQFLFFGKPSYLLGDEQKRAKALVNEWIQEIENDFEFILILEDFDRSLVLFVLKFCWDIRDVAYIKLNTMKTERNQLSFEDVRCLEKFNWADFQLYSHFKKKLNADLAMYDEKLVKWIESEIVRESELLKAGCVKPSKKPRRSESSEMLPPFRRRRSSDSLLNVKIKSGKRQNQTCFLNIEYDMVITHAQIRQILNFKNEFPGWRMDSELGNDVPQFCTPKERNKDYMKALADDELDQWDGFWKFSRFQTNEYDVKQVLSPVVAQLIENHTIHDLQNINYIFTKYNQSFLTD